MVGVAHTGKKSGAGSGDGEWWGSARAGRPARVSERRPGGPASVRGGGSPGAGKAGAQALSRGLRCVRSSQEAVQPEWGWQRVCSGGDGNTGGVGWGRHLA